MIGEERVGISETEESECDGKREGVGMSVRRNDGVGGARGDGKRVGVTRSECVRGSGYQRDSD